MLFTWHNYGYHLCMQSTCAFQALCNICNIKEGLNRGPGTGTGDRGPGTGLGTRVRGSTDQNNNMVAEAGADLEFELHVPQIIPTLIDHTHQCMVIM